MSEALNSDLVAKAEVVDPAPRRRGGWWLADFRFAGGRVRVLDTAANLEIDRHLIGDALVWLGFHVIVRTRAWLMLLLNPGAPRVWFAPHQPRPWYLVWSAMAWAGIRMAAQPEDADATFAFEDATWGEKQIPAVLPAFNYLCPDVSKSHVARVFEASFGYPLSIDPMTWNGPAVEKGELNGAHDGRIVECPTRPLPGRHYQRLIDTCQDGMAHDLRTACVGRRPVAVWIKQKPAADRFAIYNSSVTLHEPATVFSGDELDAIGRFLVAMHIDWAGLDILRDRNSGKIYIVDVNKTDVGPIIALSLRDKLRSIAILARAFEQMIGPRPPQESSWKSRR